MAWFSVVDDAFGRSNTSAGSAGSTSGLGNNWADVQGGVWSISSGQAIAQADSVNANSWSRDFAVRPGTEATQDQRLVVTTGQRTSTGNVWGGVLRYQSGSKNCYFFLFNNSNQITVWKLVSGTPTLLMNLSLPSPYYQPTHNYAVDFQATGSGPTTLSIKIYDLTALSLSALPNDTSGLTALNIGSPASVTDSEATLQNATGVMGLVANYASTNATVPYARATTYSALQYAVSVAVSDANWRAGRSPYNWNEAGGAIVTVNPGAYFKLAFSGTQLGLQVDVSPLSGQSAGNYPKIRYSIDGLAYTDYQLTSSDSWLSLATGLTDAAHTAIVYLLASESGIDRWNTPVSCLKVTAIGLDSGKALSALGTSPTLPGFWKRGNKAIFYGDSIAEGIRVLGAVTNVANQDSTQAWPFAVAQALGCEAGVVGFGGTGYDQGYINVPTFPNSWNYLYSGVARSFASAPDYLFICHGTNAGLASSATLTTLLGAIRAAVGASTWLFVVTPYAGNARANITAGVSNYLAANYGDRCALIDLGAAGTIEHLGQGVGSATVSAADYLHPNAAAHGRIGAAIAAKAQAVMTSAAAGGGYIVEG